MTKPSDFDVSNEQYRVSESDFFFKRSLDKAGVNRWAHQDYYSLVDTQQVIRENQDVIYSSAVVDVSGGATITVPDYDAYSIVQVIDLQNYSIKTVYRGTSHTISPDDVSFGSHVYLNARTQPLSLDDTGVAAANEQQRGLVIDAPSATPYESPDIVLDEDRLLAVRAALIDDVAKGMIQDFTRVMGTRDHVHTQDHLYATAYGWGGLPAADAGYLTPPIADQEDGDGHSGWSLTIDPPPLDYSMGGFWSVTAYNKEGWLAFDKAAVSSREAEANDNGTFTVRFGQPGQPNNLEIEDEFAALLRFYVPTGIDEISSYLATGRENYRVVPAR